MTKATGTVDPAAFGLDSVSLKVDNEKAIPGRVAPQDGQERPNSVSVVSKPSRVMWIHFVCWKMFQKDLDGFREEIVAHVLYF